MNSCKGCARERHLIHNFNESIEEKHANVYKEKNVEFLHMYQTIALKGVLSLKTPLYKYYFHV